MPALQPLLLDLPAEDGDAAVGVSQILVPAEGQEVGVGLDGAQLPHRVALADRQRELEAAAGLAA